MAEEAVEGIGPPLLLVLNGPPASGKSTLARCYVRDHPLALALDIDLIRRQLGGWQEHAHDSGLLARALAMACARTHLGAGHDVVVPQLLARGAFIELLEALARELDARFAEAYLCLPLEECLHRFDTRTRESGEPTHAEAAAHLRRLGGVSWLRTAHRDLTVLARNRPGAILLDVTGQDAEESYRELSRRLEETPPA